MKRYFLASILVAAPLAFFVWRSHPRPALESKPTVITPPDPPKPIAHAFTPSPTLAATPQTIPPSVPPPDALDKIHALLGAARAGDRDAQFNIAKIMRGCPNYTRKDGTRMSFEETIAAYKAKGEDIIAIHRAFEKCSRMWAADDLGTAGEWLALATKARQPQAMALTAEDLLWKMASDAVFRNAPAGTNPEPEAIDPALDTTLDPRKLLREAIESKNPDVYYAISHNALFLFPGNPDALTLSYSWMLVACQRGLDCSKNSELAAYDCSRNMVECDSFKDPRDYVLWLASNDRVDLSQVETRAADILSSLDSGDYDAIGLQ